MKNKIKFGALALAAGIVMSSQAFAVTYAPNIDDTIQKDNVEALEEYDYTQEDVEYVFELYADGKEVTDKDYQSFPYKTKEVTDKDFEKYDMNKDGKINANDAALICDYIYYN